MSYEHLPLERETPLTERHTRRYPGIRPQQMSRAMVADLLLGWRRHS